LLVSGCQFSAVWKWPVTNNQQPATI